MACLKTNTPHTHTLSHFFHFLASRYHAEAIDHQVGGVRRKLTLIGLKSSFKYSTVCANVPQLCILHITSPTFTRDSCRTRGDYLFLFHLIFI